MTDTTTRTNTDDRGPVTIMPATPLIYVPHSIPQCPHENWTAAGTCAVCGARWDACLSDDRLA